MGFPECPLEIKSMAHVLRVAEDHEESNIIVAYWARKYVCEVTMKLMPINRSRDVVKLLTALMDWLEKTKEDNPNKEGFTNAEVAQSVVENYVLQLFARADVQDRNKDFSKDTIKAFYTSGILMDVLEMFGALSEDMKAKRKHAKWKAVYIHVCLREGEDPLPGTLEENEKAVTVDKVARLRWWIKYHTTERQEKEYLRLLDLDIADLANEYQETVDEFDDIDVGSDEAIGADTVDVVMAETPTSPPPTPPPIVTLPASTTISDHTLSIYAKFLSRIEENAENIAEARMNCNIALCALGSKNIQIAMEYLVKALELLKVDQD